MEDAQSGQSGIIFNPASPVYPPIMPNPVRTTIQPTFEIRARNSFTIDLNTSLGYPESRPQGPDGSKIWIGNGNPDGSPIRIGKTNPASGLPHSALHPYCHRVQNPIRTQSGNPANHCWIAFSWPVPSSTLDKNIF